MGVDTHHASHSRQIHKFPLHIYVLPKIPLGSGNNRITTLFTHSCLASILWNPEISTGVSKASKVLYQWFNSISAGPNLHTHQLKQNKASENLQITEIHTINKFISLTLSNYMFNRSVFLRGCTSYSICWVLMWSANTLIQPWGLC